jgi:Ca2+-transporting ATPase
MIDPRAKQKQFQHIQAGIIPVMITGDHKLTAKAIAKQLGIITSEEDLIYGNKLAALSEKVSDVNGKYSLYVNVSPEQKKHKSAASKRSVLAVVGNANMGWEHQWDSHSKGGRHGST